MKQVLALAVLALHAPELSGRLCMLSSLSVVALTEPVASGCHRLEVNACRGEFMRHGVACARRTLGFEKVGERVALSLCLLKRLVLLERSVDESLGALGPVGDQGFELAPVAVGLALEGGELALLGFELRCGLRSLGGLGCKARAGCFRFGAKALVQ